MSTFLSDVHKAYLATQDQNVRNLLEPHIHDTIAQQLRMIVYFRLQAWSKEAMASHHDSFNYKHSAMRLQELLSQSWPETVAEYRNICNILNLDPLE